MEAADVVTVEVFAPCVGERFAMMSANGARRFVGIGFSDRAVRAQARSTREIMPEAVFDRRGGEIANVRRADRSGTRTAAGHQYRNRHRAGHCPATKPFPSHPISQWQENLSIANRVSSFAGSIAMQESEKEY